MFRVLGPMLLVLLLAPPALAAEGKRLLGAFKITYYWLAQERPGGGPRSVEIFDRQGASLGLFSKRFVRALANEKAEEAPKQLALTAAVQVEEQAPSMVDPPEKHVQFPVVVGSGLYQTELTLDSNDEDPGYLPPPAAELGDMPWFDVGSD